MFQTRIIKKQLHFKQPAGTSRGVYTTRNVWYASLSVYSVRSGNRPTSFPRMQPTILAHSIQQRKSRYPYQWTYLDGKL